MDKRKSVLITGINGYIGQKLSAALLQEGYAVWGIDKGETPYCDDVTYVQTDITNEAAVRAFFASHKINAVVHLAALVHKAGNDLSRQAYDRINYYGSRNIFHAAADNGVSTMLFASTIEVYGEQDEQIIDENTPCNPVSFYAISKYAAEQELLSMQEKFQSYAILRFAPVYGEDFRLNLNKRFYICNTRIAIYFKDGRYAFHFSSIDRIRSFLPCLLENGAPSGIYNVSDDEPIVAIDFLKEERFSGRVRLLLHPPFWLAYAGISMLEFIWRFLSRSEPFLSRYNLKKMFQNRVYSNEMMRHICVNEKMKRIDKETLVEHR